MQRANKEIEKFMDEPFIGLTAPEIQVRRFKNMDEENDNEEVLLAKRIFKKSRE